MLISHAGAENARRNGIGLVGAVIREIDWATVKASPAPHSAAIQRGLVVDRLRTAARAARTANTVPVTASGTSDASTGTVMFRPVPSLKFDKNVIRLPIASA